MSAEVIATICVVVPAVLAWGTTEAIKRAWLLRYKMRHEGVDTMVARERAWWFPLLVFLSIAIGSVVGLLIGSIPDDLDAGYGAALGSAGGVLASLIVKLLKECLDKLADRMPGMPR